MNKEKEAKKEVQRNAHKTAPTGKFVKMKFGADQYYGVAVEGNVTESLKTPLYKKDEVCEVPEHMVPRWLKRGGVIVAEEKADNRGQESAKVEEPTKEQVEGGTKKEDDVTKPETVTKPTPDKKAKQ